MRQDVDGMAGDDRKLILISGHDQGNVFQRQPTQIFHSARNFSQSKEHIRNDRSLRPGCCQCWKAMSDARALRLQTVATNGTPPPSSESYLS